MLSLTPVIARANSTLLAAEVVSSSLTVPGIVLHYRLLMGILRLKENVYLSLLELQTIESKVKVCSISLPGGTLISVS